MQWAGRLPKLPPKAAYLLFHNPQTRNSLDLETLRSLRSQLHKYLTCPTSGRLLVLPRFRPSVLLELEHQQRIRDDDAVSHHQQRDTGPAAAGQTRSSNMSESEPDYRWLLDAAAWNTERAGLPSVLVLRSGPGPVFCSGHNPRELTRASRNEVRETFRLCAEVMSLIRRFPGLVVCAVQGLATAAGCQLALTADITVAAASTPFQLPGMRIGLPCSSPVTAVSRRVPSGLAYRMFATAEPVRADQMQGAIDVVPESSSEPTDEVGSMAALDARVEALVKTLTGATPAQAQALGKWAYWTQLGIDGARASLPADPGDSTGEAHVRMGISESGGDGYEDAAAWAGRMMAVHARNDDALDPRLTRKAMKKEPLSFCT